VEPRRCGMASVQLDEMLRDYLETRFGLGLDFFAIEGRMTADAQGDVGVTGNYRKKAGDKNVFFTATVNLPLHTVVNLQEYI